MWYWITWVKRYDEWEYAGEQRLHSETHATMTHAFAMAGWQYQSHLVWLDV